MTLSHNQTHRLRLISPGDVTYILASLFLNGMQLLPASYRIRVINKISTFLGWLLYAVNAHSTKTMRENLNTMLGSDRSPDLVEADLRHLLSLTVWNALVINSLPVLPREQIADLVGTLGKDQECLLCQICCFGLAFCQRQGESVESGIKSAHHSLEI